MVTASPLHQHQHPPHHGSITQSPIPQWWGGLKPAQTGKWQEQVFVCKNVDLASQVWMEVGSEELD